jgi:AcrR family transcriptional regulator
MVANSSTDADAIATAAGVDPAMVFYFFGTEQGHAGAVAGHRVGDEHRAR